MRCQAFTIRLDERQSLDLSRLNDFLERVQPIQVSSALVSGSAPVWSVLVFYEGETPKAKEGLEKPLPEASAKPRPTATNDALYQALREWRWQKAKAEGVPPYVIAHDAQLAAIADALPSTPEELTQIKGFGPRKTERYGEEILALVREKTK
ncbi:HRDC domain-containing protein [Calidithermus roseus]|uniref:ATP-dependent DNA helicase UvrD2 n=1 Tax=Calidithermus roseus TaxID=1644118 RepID=A0A399EZF3_9DEIN|nr:HRDC domain-containing protein [Calidithermus roseus]RIH88409.1 ATP-dependent DNA helicase UvrD2 [Calidithermus roseus]